VGATERYGWAFGRVSDDGIGRGGWPIRQIA
jgi:hypothetical protein